MGTEFVDGRGNRNAGISGDGKVTRMERGGGWEKESSGIHLAMIAAEYKR